MSATGGWAWRAASPESLSDSGLWPWPTYHSLAWRPSAAPLRQHERVGQLDPRGLGQQARDACLRVREGRFEGRASVEVSAVVALVGASGVPDGPRHGPLVRN